MQNDGCGTARSSVLKEHKICESVRAASDEIEFARLIYWENAM